MALQELGAGRRRDVVATSPVLYIAAKPPVAGSVKTRLARAIGLDAATSLYAAFVHDIAAEVRGGSLPAGWFLPSAPDWQPPALGSQQVVTRWQNGSTWSERQANLFRDSFEEGIAATVIVASDSPQVAGSGMRAALDALADADVVLGPVLDGGYYLLGWRGDHDIVRGIEMSTPRACADIIERARGLKLALRLLPETFDVDEVGDLERLTAAAAVLPHLRATRAALAAASERSLGTAMSAR